MIRAIHLNLAHREVVIVAEAEGSAHGRSVTLSDGANGLPTFEDFTGYHGAEIGKLVESAEELAGEVPAQGSQDPAPGNDAPPTSPGRAASPAISPPRRSNGRR